MAVVVAWWSSPTGVSAATLLWDANSGTTGAQDGSGTWAVGSGNWRNTGTSTNNQTFANGDTVTFGAGSGAAGTVTVSGTVSTTSMTFTAPGSGNYAVNGGTITLTGSATIGTTANASIGSVIGGTVAIAKTGTGVLTLSGTNTFTGQLNVQAGTVAVGTINNSGSSGVLGNSTNSVSLGGSGGVTGTLQYTGATASSTKKFTMATGGTGVFQVASAGTNLTLSGIIDGSGAMAKTGAGTLTLSGNNTLTGQLSVQAGTLAIATLNNDNANGAVGKSTSSVVLGASGGATGTLQYTGASASSSKKFTMAAGGTGAFQIDTAGTTLTLSGIIDGSGDLNKTGAGTLSLSGVNTYSGNTVIVNGTLKVANASSIPSGSGKGNVVLNGGASTAGILDVAGLNVSINGLSGTTGTVLGTVINSTAATSRTLTVGNNNATSTFAGTIKDNNGLGGTISLSKVGSGTQTLTGTNTYTGTTTVTGGTLQVGNSGIGSTGTGATTVGDGTNAATLAGSGTIGGTAIVTNHVVKANAFLKPGDGGGSLNGTLAVTGNLNLNTNSVTQLQLTSATTTADPTFGGNWVGTAGYLSYLNAHVAAWNSATGGNHDGVSVQGTLTLGTNAAGLIQVMDNGYASVAKRGDVIDVLDWNAISLGSFSVGTNYRSGGLGGGDLLLMDLSALGLRWDLRKFATDGILIVVPEPSRAGLLLVAAIPCLWRRRRSPSTAVEMEHHATAIFKIRAATDIPT